MKRIATALKINDVRMFEERFKGISSDTVVMDTPELEGLASLSYSYRAGEDAHTLEVGKYQAAYFPKADLLMIRGLQEEDYKRADKVFDVGTLGRLMSTFSGVSPDTKVADRAGYKLTGTALFEAYRIECAQFAEIGGRTMGYFKKADILMVGSGDEDATTKHPPLIWCEMEGE